MYGKILEAIILLRASESHETMLEKFNDMDYSFTHQGCLDKTHLFRDNVKFISATILNR